MKNQIKTTANFLLFYLIFIVLFIFPGMVTPRSEKMSEILALNEAEMQHFFPLLLLFGLYMTITYWLLAKNVNEKKSHFFGKLLAANLLIYPLMGFLESLFWRDAFQELSTLEIFSIFYPFIITFILFTIYITIIARPHQPILLSPAGPPEKLSFKQIIQRIALIALIYFIVYNLAGYFIAWQFAETRVFYSGSSEIDNFIVAFGKNITNLKFVSVHLFRGILFALAGLILYDLLKSQYLKKVLIMALLFGGFGFQILLPNPLFPPMVRISHFIETTISMLIFGAIVAIVFNYRAVSNRTVKA